MPGPAAPERSCYWEGATLACLAGLCPSRTWGCWAFALHGCLGCGKQNAARSVCEIQLQRLGLLFSWLFFPRIERSTDQVIKPVNMEALSKWIGHIPGDVLQDMAHIAPMLARLGYDPYANPPNYGHPDPLVVNNTHRVSVAAGAGVLCTPRALGGRGGCWTQPRERRGGANALFRETGNAVDGAWCGSGDGVPHDPWCVQSFCPGRCRAVAP